MQLGFRSTVRGVAAVATVLGLVAAPGDASTGSRDSSQQPDPGIVVQQAQLPSPPALVFPIEPYPCGSKRLQGRQCVRFTGGPHLPEGHESYDFAGRDYSLENRSVVAVADGEAYWAKCRNSVNTGVAKAPGTLWVDHGNGWKSAYYHVVAARDDLDSETDPRVTVKQGEAIASLAVELTHALPCDGSWSGAHVHFTLYYNGKKVSPTTYTIGGYKPASETRLNVNPYGYAWGIENLQTGEVFHPVSEVPVSAASPSEPTPAPTSIPLVGDIDPATAISLGRVSAVLVVDSSGSMSWNDPQRERVDAGKVFLSVSRLGDEVGVVDFDHAADTTQELVRIGVDRALLEEALDLADAEGGTDIGGALRVACRALFSAEHDLRAALLLTDGQGSYSGEASCFADRGWKVYTIGLGSDVDARLLRSIAQQTGGQYLQLDDANDLPCEFSKIRQHISEETRAECPESRTISQGEPTRHLATVTPVMQQMTFTNTWSGSDVAMTVYSPTGRVASRHYESWSHHPGLPATPDVRIEVGSTYETITVTIPTPGEWVVEVQAVDVPEEGEPHWLSGVALFWAPGDYPKGQPVRNCAADARHPFVDVPEESYAAQDVACLFDLGIVSGTTALTYSPSRPVTRRQMASMLARTYRTRSGRACPEGTPPHPFVDVPRDSHASDDISCLYGLGVVSGTSESTYSPLRQVTRQQLAAMLARLYRTLTGTLCPLNKRPPPFADVPGESYAADDIVCLYDLKVVSGTSASTFSPSKPVKRGQMAAMLARLYRSMQVHVI